MTLTSASIYSGVGGSDFGLQQAGFTPTWTAERDPFRRAILSARWPAARHYTEEADVRYPSPVTLLWADLTDPLRWSRVFAFMRLLMPAWTVFEASPSLFLEPILRDLARDACYDWGFMPLYVQVHTTVPTLAPEWEDHRLRLLLVITKDGRHRDLGLTSPQLSMDVTTQAPASDATPVEKLELSRGLPVAWSCLCAARPCRCDARERVAAIAECTPPTITHWLGGLIAAVEARRAQLPDGAVVEYGAPA